MKINELRELQAKFELGNKMRITAKSNLKALEKQFVAYFNPGKIKEMIVQEYVLGLEKPDQGFNFCYGLETQLKGLGWMIGGTSKKFGFYYGKLKPEKNRKYRYTKLFGNDTKVALAKVKSLILELLEAGKARDLNSIDANRLSPMFKGKILSTYFPKRYLNIFAKDHLDHYLSSLNLSSTELKKKSEVWKREALMQYKNSDIVMKKWSPDIFSDFLYDIFPLPPKKSFGKRLNIALKEHMPFVFPESQKATIVNLSIIPPVAKDSHLRNQETSSAEEEPTNPDYESRSRRHKQLGDKGEELALDYERKKLLEAGHSILTKKVAKIKRDSEGYDIHSFEEDGTPMQIEVKTTRSKVGQANFFLSSNELKQAKELDNYYLYMVYEILSKNPKIWIVKNPFHPRKTSVVLTPMNYRVQINTK